MMRLVGQCIASTDDQVVESYCAYSVRVGEVNVTFCKVSCIVMRKNSVRAYFDVDITVKVCFLMFPIHLFMNLFHFLFLYREIVLVVF